MNTAHQLSRFAKALVYILALCLSLSLPASLYATSVGEIAVQGTVGVGTDKTSEEIQTSDAPKPPSKAKPPKKVSTDLRAKTGEASTALILSATVLGSSILLLLIFIVRDYRFT
jgi:hypothetical protein